MNYFDPKHPHEPEISPQFDVDGRCLICVMICQRDKAIRELNIEKKIAQKACLRIARLERVCDEARGALMKIEDLFVDGTDVYADREKMGMIARNALEGAK